MRLLILGATGGIGRHLLQFALAHGHEVTAFVRAPQKVDLRHERLKIVPGDLLDINQLAQVMPGHDVVLSAFGPSTLRQTTMRRDFGRTLSAAMQQSRVRRVLLVSSALLFRDIGAFAAVLRRLIFRNLPADMAGMEDAIRNDALDWTIVRPPRLTNGDLTKNYRVDDGDLPKGGLTISRASVADFMVREAENPGHIRQIVGICK